MMKLSAYTLAVIALSGATTTSNAFVVQTPRAIVATTSSSRTLPPPPPQQDQQSPCTARFMSERETTESAFVADVVVGEEDGEVEDDEDKTFEAVEMMGKGAAKAKRGKRKGGEAASSAAPTKAFATLTPEETFYEGPPAITETIAPTISILTVVGIVPAAAAWARQAWVRYTITNRRIRVTSGIGGKDMAEIVYPDVVEIRTVKRLFGDGDMVFFLRDGAKFEMRNVPNFDETIKFVLGNVKVDVADMYRRKGDVGTQ